METIRFERLTDTAHPHFSVLLDLYHAAFPANERHPDSVITERIDAGTYHVFAGVLDKAPVFMALLWPLRGTGFTLLDYMATDASMRGKAVGSQFLRYLKEDYLQGNGYLILETEDPDFGENREERARRVGFYRRNGAQLIKGLRYLLSPLQGDQPTDMRLMIFPEYSSRIEAGIVRDLVGRIYRELYGREENDPYVQRAIGDNREYYGLE